IQFLECHLCITHFIDLVIIHPSSNNWIELPWNQLSLKMANQLEPGFDLLAYLLLGLRLWKDIPKSPIPVENTPVIPKRKPEKVKRLFPGYYLLALLYIDGQPHSAYVAV